MHSDLRQLRLQGWREKFGLAARSKPIEPWGIGLDWGVGVHRNRGRNVGRLGQRLLQ